MPDKEPAPRAPESTSAPAEKPVETAHPWSMASKIGGATFGTIIAPILVALLLKWMDSGSNPQPPPASNRTENKAADTASVSTPSLTAGFGPSSSSTTNSTTTKATIRTSAEPSAAEASANQDHATKRRRKAEKPTAEKSSESAKFHPLFNGQDLSGWKPIDVKRWSVDVKNQVLVGNDYENDQRNLKKNVSWWIFTEQEFSDCVLRFQFRFDPKTDAGVVLRTKTMGDVSENDRFEIQLINDPSAVISTGTILGLRAGQGHPHTKPTSEVDLLPQDQWNAVEIVFRGPHLQMTINGKLIQDARLEDSLQSQSGKVKKSFSPTGRIGLQIRAGRAEFRDIEIRELNN